jgi:hypothetical protein
MLPYDCDSTCDDAIVYCRWEVIRCVFVIYKEALDPAWYDEDDTTVIFTDIDKKVPLRRAPPQRGMLLERCGRVGVEDFEYIQLSKHRSDNSNKR